MGSLFAELKRRKVLRVAAAYIVSSWVLLQVADLLADILELPAWAPKLVFLLLVVGFVPALILSWAFDLTSMGVRSETAGVGRGAVAAAIAIAIAGLAGGGWWYAGSDLRWARTSGLDELEALVGRGDRAAAFALARRIEALLPDEPELDEIWTTFAWKTSITTEPEGADVFWRPYERPDAEWQHLGQTPLHDIWVPHGASVLSMKKDGYAPLLRVIGGLLRIMKHLPEEDEPLAQYNINPGAFRFFEPAEIPEDMVYVPGWDGDIDGKRIQFRSFFIGRFEVTNREYQEFVDAGGYRRRDLWEFEFVDGDETLSFDEAMQRFVDATGRTGPAAWQGGAYPEGYADHPVTGLSWYEAAAYARFRGRQLPTIHHWRRAMSEALLAWELPASNVNSDGLARVGEFQSIGWTGTYDMAGNAREWCFNESDDGSRAIVGAAWDEAPYMVLESMAEPHRIPPMNRSAVNGLRLMEAREEAAVMAMARQPVQQRVSPPLPDAVSDEAFAAMVSAFGYDRAPLNAEVEEEADFRHWQRQRIWIDGEPGEERIVLYLYLPNRELSRFHTVVFWPGGATQFIDSVNELNFVPEFIVRSGRAVVLPVLKGMFERRVVPPPDWTTHAGRNLAIDEVRELRRILDYLETRDDIRSDSLAFYGQSWGGRMGAIILAVEPRFKVGILNQAGVNTQDHNDINVVHYLPRVNAPVLHFSGLYDTDFEFETSSKPFFERLGTPAEHKKHVVENTGHFVPVPVVVGESLDWLDRYQGSVD